MARVLQFVNGAVIFLLISTPIIFLFFIFGKSFAFVTIFVTVKNKKGSTRVKSDNVRRKQVYFILAVVVLAGIFLYAWPENPQHEFNFQITQASTFDKQAIFTKTDISMPAGVLSVHAATLTYLENGDLLAAFFAGSREGARDVRIYGSVYMAKKQQWSEPFVMLTREQLSQKSGQYIKKLGNPVLYRNKNRIYLFVVGVSIGGWATSKIYQLYQNDFSPDKAFTYQKTLQLSPFLNLSNLVRSVPVETSDGGFYLPVYHELADKYALILKFDASGKLTSVIKPNQLHGQLQPDLIPLSASHCLAIFRNHQGYDNTMFSQSCLNGGKRWLPVEKTNVKNYDNSANLVNVGGDIYLIHNTLDENPKLERGTLTLAKMDSPGEFAKVFDLDYTTSPNGEVSYPTTITDGDNVDIVYTRDRKNIRHIRFNRAYLKDRE